MDDAKLRYRTRSYSGLSTREASCTYYKINSRYRYQTAAAEKKKGSATVCKLATEAPQSQICSR